MVGFPRELERLLQHPTFPDYPLYFLWGLHQLIDTWPTWHRTSKRTSPLTYAPSASESCASPRSAQPILLQPLLVVLPVTWLLLFSIYHSPQMLVRLRFLPVLSPAGHQDSCYCFLLLIQALLAKCNLFRFLLPKLIKCHTHLGLRPLKPRPCLTAKLHFSLFSSITLCSPALLRPLPMPPIFSSLSPYWSCGRDVLPAPVRKQLLILLQTLAEPSLSWNVYQETQDLWGLPCHKIQRSLHFYY